MKKIIIVHGWSGSPDTNWIPWVTSEFEKMHFNVVAPYMPGHDEPKIDDWVNKLKEVVRNPDQETYFIGHSIGCQTILRYLETIENKVGGALFVAGWFNLENMESHEEERIAEPWIKTSIDFQKIKNILPKSILLISDNDPYGALEENIEKFSKIVTSTVISHNAGHITESIEPSVLNQFTNLLEK